ncbi:MAG TPA: sulfite oxidase-like oxidoreductase [Ktedonobacterales bacterium]|jgi:DMSO/TMAO reductase YedYZ molybdopterin-dependent catalytic subunit
MGIFRRFAGGSWQSQTETGGTETEGADEQRLPPGQYLTKKWPVLSYETTPHFDPAKYRFKVWGTVEQPFELTWQELQVLPRINLTTDIHCVTTWSRYDNAWEGIPIRAIIERAKPTEATRFVVAHSWTGYTTNLPFADLNDEDVLIAFKHDGAEIEANHGGPVRLVVPKLYFYKSAKWLSGIEFLAGDRPGFWEVRGYHNHADPWREERYW